MPLLVASLMISPISRSTKFDGGRMGECIYCGRSAGWFRSEHPACREWRTEGLDRLQEALLRGFEHGTELSTVEREITEIVVSHRLQDLLRPMLIRAWSEALERMYVDGVLGDRDADLLGKFQIQFGLSADELDEDGSFRRLMQALLLRSLSQGTIDPGWVSGVPDGLNLQRGERVVWSFDDAELHQEKTRREYVGGSRADSVRLARGVYARESESHSQSFDYREMAFADSGVVVMTDRNLYFSGDSRAWRLPWSKIIKLTPYNDGIGIIRDGANANPQTLLIPEAEFAFKLARQLIKMQADA